MERFKSKVITKIWTDYLGILEDDHARFPLGLYETLSQAKRIKLAELEEMTGINMRRLKKLAKKRPHTHFSEEHEITAHGVMQLNPTDITLKTEDGVELYCTSAFESLFCSQLTAQKVEIKAPCVDMIENISVRLSQFGFETEQDDLYISLPNADLFENEDFLNLAKTSFFIKSEESADKWLADKPEKMALPLSQAFQVARMILDETYGVDRFVELEE